MILTMNFKPVHVSKIGFYSIFLHMQYFGLKGGHETKFCINGVTESFLDALRVLGINSELVHDVTKDDLKNLIPKVAELEAKYIIQEVQREMYFCLCGKIFYPASASIFSIKKTLFSEGVAKCCNSTLQKNTFLVLQTAKMSFTSGSQFLPHHSIGNEITEIERRFTGQQVVVSKTYDTGFPHISLSGNQYFLDRDFLDYLFPFSFAKHVTHITGGRNLIKHTFFYKYFGGYLSKSATDFILLPKIDYTGNNTLYELVDQFGAEIVRERLLELSMSKRNLVSVCDADFSRKSQKPRILY